MGFGAAMKAALAGALALLAAPGWTAERLVLQLKGAGRAQSAGYLTARDRGLYAAEGLDVTIRPGGEGNEPLDALATGAADVAVEWMPAALVAREKGLPAVNIAQPFARPALTLICWRRAGVDTPGPDLAGKTVGVTFGGDLYPFVAWMNRLGVHTTGGPDGVTMIDRGEGMAALQAKRAACVAAPVHEALPQPAADFVVFQDDEGTLPDGLYTLQGALTDPAMQDRLARFVRASMKGWDETVRGSDAPPEPRTDDQRASAAVAALVSTSGGRLDIGAAERTAQALLGGPAPVLSAPPAGAWTQAVADRAAQGGTAPVQPIPARPIVQPSR